MRRSTPRTPTASLDARIDRLIDDECHRALADGHVGALDLQVIVGSGTGRVGVAVVSERVEVGAPPTWPDAMRYVIDYGPG